MFKLSLKFLVSLFLIWYLSILLVSFSADYFLTYAPSFPYSDVLARESHLPRFIYSLANFDGVHYLTIAQKGYLGTALIQAFFPVFPYLIRFINILIGNQIISGLLLSAISCVLSWWLLIKLFKLDYPENQVKWSVLSLVFFPTSFFLIGLYSESLFMTLVLASFLAARKKHWWLAGILAGIASATRVVGIFLLPALFWEWLMGERKKTDLLAISLSATGLISYMWFLWSQFRDPLYFLHVQSEFGAGRQTNLILYPQTWWRALKIVLTARPFNLKYWAYLQEFFIGSIGLLSLILSYVKKVRTSYLIFSLLSFILPTLTGTFSSMPRYILVCFPLYLLIGQFLTKHAKFRFCYLVVSTLLLIFNLLLFIEGYWVA